MSESESQDGSQSASGPQLSKELGTATIVYEDPEEGQKELTVPNEQLVYAQDHWAFMSGTDDEGNDLVRRVPRERVHYVERNVQKFEEEVKTVRHRVESLANEVRQKLPMTPGGGGQGGGGTRGGGSRSERSEPQRIEVEDGSEDDAESSTQSRDEGQ